MSACGACGHFTGDPLALEAELPGLAALSSAHASSRSADGCCLLHDRHVRAAASCAAFMPLRDASNA